MNQSGQFLVSTSAIFFADCMICASNFLRSSGALISSCPCRLVMISFALLLKEYAFDFQCSILSILTLFLAAFDFLLLSIASFRFSAMPGMWSLYNLSPLLPALVTSQKCLL